MDDRLEANVKEGESSQVLLREELKLFLDRQRKLLEYAACHRTNCSRIGYSGIVKL